MSADLSLHQSQPESEWREIAEWDWVKIGSGEALHAVGWLTNPTTADDDWYGSGGTACGRRGIMHIPGLFSRMSAKRCDRCCKARQMPRGKGSPKNDDRCRAIVTGRLAAEAAVARAFEDAVF